MLKKDLRETIQALEDQLLNYEATIHKQKQQLSELRDRKSEYNKLENHIDDAKTAIEAIMSINCRDNVEWNRHGYPSLQYAKDNNEDIPVCPPITELYSSLRHIEEILNRPVTEPKKDTRFGY